MMMANNVIYSVLFIIYSVDLHVCNYSINTSVIKCLESFVLITVNTRVVCDNITWCQE
jgi:hypothetical protein